MANDRTPEQTESAPPATRIPLTNAQREHSLKLALAAARTAEENNGQDIEVLDMTGITALFDYFVIVTGSSQRQLNAISEEIQHCLEKELQDKRFSDHSVERSSWIVLDYGSVVIHLFDADTRQFYSLETLWADSPRIPWQAQPNQTPPKPMTQENTDGSAND